MRSVTFRYPDRDALVRDLEREDPELPLPSGQRGTDGEWVLAVFRTEDGSAATAAAARIEARDGGLALVFESRDWGKMTSELGILLAPASPIPEAARPSAPPRSMKGALSKRAKSKPKVKAAEEASSSKKAKGPRNTMPPPSRSGTVLTRTLVPPQAEIHEADAPDHTLEATLGADDGVKAAPSKKLPRLLLVDDDEATQELISEMLEAIEIRVECASDAEEALDRVVLEAFDLVMLDWNLPGMTGLELCRELRKHPNPRIATMPILFLTGKSASRDLVDAFAAGADDFVAKPFRAPELGARLLALLRRVRNLSMPPPSR